MAGSLWQLDSSGLLKLKDNGIVVAGVGDPCCCASYVQAKQCLDNSLADLWISSGSHTLPYYFAKSGVCYYIPAGAATSASPGTLLTGETVLASCGVSPCACSNCPDAVPGQYTVTLSGITFCVCQPNPTSGAAITVTGTINGTYCLTRTGDATCTWSTPLSGLASFAFSSYTVPSPCDPSVVCAQVSGSIRLVRSTVSGWFLCATINVGTCGGNVALFTGTATTANCNTSFSMTNAIVACDGSDGLGGACGVGGATGGSAAISPGC